MDEVTSKTSESTQIAGFWRRLPFVELLSVQRALQQEPSVRHAMVNISVNKFFSNEKGTTTTHIFGAKPYLSKRMTNLDSLANQSVRIILDRDPSAANADIIAVSIVYDYDIGIASAWHSQNFAFSPAQWRKRFVSV